MWLYISGGCVLFLFWYECSWVGCNWDWRSGDSFWDICNWLMDWWNSVVFDVFWLFKWFLDWYRVWLFVFFNSCDWCGWSIGLICCGVGRLLWFCFYVCLWLCGLCLIVDGGLWCWICVVWRNWWVMGVWVFLVGWDYCLLWRWCWVLVDWVVWFWCWGC